MTTTSIGDRRGRLSRLGIAGLSALALTFVTGVGATASTDTTEPAGTEPAGTEAAGTEPAGTAAAGGDFVIGVSNTIAGNGWREEMICSVKAQSLASGQVSEVIAISP